jgi:hypothetical protein
MKTEIQSFMHLHVLVSLSSINCKNKSRVIPVPKHHTKKVNRSSKGKGRMAAQKLLAIVFLSAIIMEITHNEE